MATESAETDGHRLDPSVDRADPAGDPWQTSGTQRETERTSEAAGEEQTATGVARNVEEPNGATGG